LALTISGVYIVICNSSSAITSEIAFSQVREDPRIELRVIQELAKRQQPLRVLLVASGGCTALSLLSNPVIAKIEAVDLNPAQLHLLELRRQALLHLSLDEQLRFIGVDKSISDRDRLSIYASLSPNLPTSTKAFWDARLEQIGFGVNQVGRFEQLFRQLAEKFSQIGIEPLQEPLIAVNHPRWRDIFEKVFERDRLIESFGEAAVNYSMDRSFGEHFADVFAQALQRFIPNENYFLTQVWGDRYTSDLKGEGVPLYLQASAQNDIRTLGTERLQLHQGAFVDCLQQLATSEKFDLIQFSNISDWMPLSSLHHMLKEIVNCLKSGGAIIGRRLNGDHNLAEIMAEHITIDRSLSQELLASDRSFFYREVVVGFRL
jgi:S-adenosylmethionine-diacylglycerol 3-amino-3-carboxypropyl transferase